MATCNDIVTSAMGRIRQIRVGESPTGAEAADAMNALQGLYDGWVATGLFGRLNDTIISGDYAAQEQDRVINDGGYNVSLPLQYTNNVAMGTYYPLMPDERIYTYLQTTTPRPPRDLSMIEVQAVGSLKRYLYNARTRAWVSMTGLALTDVAPLADRGSVGLASCLAEMLSDEYGEPCGPDVQKRASLFMWGVSSRYDSTRVSSMQAYF